jgi:hypothetical protein
MQRLEIQGGKYAWAGLPVFMAILSTMGCGNHREANSPDPDTSKEVKEAGQAAARDVKESAEDAKDKTEDAAHDAKKKVHDATED